MTEYHHLNHATRECKYHVVLMPKYRKKTLFGTIRPRLGQVLRELAQRKLKQKTKQITEQILGLKPNFSGCGQDARQHVALGLIFVKYISDSFEAKHAALEKEGEDAEDRDYYTAENVF